MEQSTKQRMEHLVERLIDCIDDERIVWKLHRTDSHHVDNYVAELGGYSLEVYYRYGFNFSVVHSDGRVLETVCESPALDGETGVVAKLYTAIKRKDLKADEAITDVLKYLEDM